MHWCSDTKVFFLPYVFFKPDLKVSNRLVLSYFKCTHVCVEQTGLSVGISLEMSSKTKAIAKLFHFPSRNRNRRFLFFFG